MLRSVFRFVALVSALGATAVPALGERPRFGGTLRVEISASLARMDPENEPPDSVEAAARARLMTLVFEGLVAVDGRNRLQPGLAVAWTGRQDGRQWRFQLRENVVFHDGSLLDAETVVASLTPKLSGLHIEAEGAEILITCDPPLPDLPAELATPLLSIWRRTEDGGFAGTGPFRVVRWEATAAELEAHDNHWAGRPFLDAVSVRMGRSQRQRLLSLETGRADVVELEIEGAAAAGGPERVWASAPVELLALVPDEQLARETPGLREALARSIDRQAIHSVIFQSHGKPAFALLPDWLGGYEFLFETPRELEPAPDQPANGGSRRSPIPLVYSPGRPLDKAAAERIALDARASGITLRPAAGPWDGRDAVRLRRLRVTAPRASAALRTALAALGLPSDVAGGSIESVYAAEFQVVAQWRVIPLLHLPERYGIGRGVRVWRGPAIQPGGEWRFGEVWLEPNP